MGLHYFMLFACLTNMIRWSLTRFALFCFTIWTEKTIVCKLFQVLFINFFSIFSSFRCILCPSFHELKFAFTLYTINKISHATIHQLIFNLVHFLASKDFLNISIKLLLTDSKVFIHYKKSMDMDTYIFPLHWRILYPSM